MISEQAQLITQYQFSLLKELKLFQSPLEIHSLTQIPLLNASSNLQNSQAQKISKDLNHNLSKSIDSINFQTSLSYLKQSSNISQPKHDDMPKHKPSQSNGLLFIDKQLERQGSQKYMSMKKQLISYKQKSQQIYKVAEFIKAYEENFTFLVTQKDSLVQMLNSIKGETTELVDKQRKLIDLSITVKESLDYYTYHQKNIFNYACEISSRQLFEDSLQSTLSTIMDAIEFFEQNQTFVQSKKQLNIYLSSKSKILSFIKSFYIKLFNKENAFIMKHLNSNKIDSQMNTLYPKSRIKLLSDFLLTFPHMKRELKEILLNLKDQNVDNEQKEIEFRFLQMRQMEIDEFLLSDSNISLIRYLEKNNYELYTEVMLNLFTFNRFNFHQNFIFNWGRKIGNDQIVGEQKDKQRQKLKQFKSKIYFVIQTIISEYIYFHLCCHPSTTQSIEFITAWLYKLVYKYLEVLVKEAREFVVRYKFNPFELCQHIVSLIDKELAGYFDHLAKEQYQSYVIGCLWQALNAKSLSSSNKKLAQQQNPHVKLLKDLFKNSLKTRIIAQIGQFCFQNLPKLQLTQKRQQVEQNINKLIYFIPKLQYCTSNADSYMISSLDILIKSIKQINHTIESRFECYSWNLLVFGVIRNILQAKEFQVVSKEIRLDFNESLNIIDRVKQLQRPESLIRYAQDIFNVIKTGMPSLNELTLDFNKYVNEHYEELESRFLKDILFIYAKNMVQFLQKIMDTKKRISSEKEIKKASHLDESHPQEQVSELNASSQKSIHSQHESSGHPQSKKECSKSPKGQKKNIPPVNQLQRICDSGIMKSLYNSYVLSIQKYIRQAREMIKKMEESKIERRESEIHKLKILIREVYEKMFDFLDTFYVAVSQVNSQVTSEFQEISTIKQKQQTLWMIK